MAKFWDRDWRKVSYWVIGITIFGLLGYDLLPAFSSADGDTISEAARDLAWGTQALPAFCGFLMGHLFWGRKGGRYWSKSWVLIPVILIATLLADFFAVADLNPAFVFPVYFVLGHLVWTQDSNEARGDAGDRV